MRKRYTFKQQGAELAVETKSGTMWSRCFTQRAWRCVVCLLRIEKGTMCYRPLTEVAPAVERYHRVCISCVEGPPPPPTERAA